MAFSTNHHLGDSLCQAAVGLSALLSISRQCCRPVPVLCAPTTTCPISSFDVIKSWSITCNQFSFDFVITTPRQLYAGNNERVACPKCGSTVLTKGAIKLSGCVLYHFATFIHMHRVRLTLIELFVNCGNKHRKTLKRNSSQTHRNE